MGGTLSAANLVQFTPLIGGITEMANKVPGNLDRGSVSSFDLHFVRIG